MGKGFLVAIVDKAALPDIFFFTCAADRNPSGDEPKYHAINAFQDSASEKVHELLDQYVATLVLAGVLSFSNYFIPFDNLFTNVYCLSTGTESVFKLYLF